MVDLLESFLAIYLLFWSAIGFVIVFRSGALHGTEHLLKIQKKQWYRTIGVINSFAVFTLCILVLVG